MTVLVTAASSRTSAIIARQLAAAGHDLRLTDVASTDNLARAHNFMQCDLGHGTKTDDLVAGVDAIALVGCCGYTSADPNMMIDYHTRRTYNLLWAGADAGVERVVHLSTLQLMAAYEENLVVTENWKTLPHAGDVTMLCAHLSETVCKEFARDRKLRVVNLRLGWPIVDDAASASDNVADGSEIADSALTAADLGTAVGAALTADIPQWQTLHVQSAVPNQRYTTARASRMLGITL